LQNLPSADAKCSAFWSGLTPNFASRGKTSALRAAFAVLLQKLGLRSGRQIGVRFLGKTDSGPVFPKKSKIIVLQNWQFMIPPLPLRPE
jgi:hypothetical protein